MNLRDFIMFTLLGAGIWNIILAVIGFYLYAIRDQIFPYVGHILLGVGVIFTIYLIVKSRKNKKDAVGKSD
jgi:membrane protein DedA with SNARE-associated domain